MFAQIAAVVAGSLFLVAMFRFITFKRKFAEYWSSIATHHPRPWHIEVVEGQVQILDARNDWVLTTQDLCLACSIVGLLKMAGDIPEKHECPNVCDVVREPQDVQV